jgi:hypothetical protein
MSSANHVPETRDLQGAELSADEAWETLRRYGRWHLAKDAFARFRYADGFSHSRALAMQLCLAAVPFLIALTGLAADLGQDKGGESSPGPFSPSRPVTATNSFATHCPAARRPRKPARWR